MAPPGKPSAPVVTARTSESLTLDWPPLAGVSYVLRAREPAGLPVELGVAVPPARIESLAANEIYLVTLEALNSDGASGESAPAVEWTDPLTPKTAPATYVMASDGTVSIGWDLTSDLAALRHRDTIAVEVGRSDGSAPVPKIVAAGKIRDLCFDLRAPVGQLQYQLRLRADRPPPQTPVFSQWGPATPASKLTPGRATQGNAPSRNGLASPLIGGQAFRALALAKKNEEDGDDNNDNSKNGSDPNKPEPSNPAPADGGGRKADPSPGDAGASDGKAWDGMRDAPIPPDSRDKVNGGNVDLHTVEIPNEIGPPRQVEIPFETKKTADGTWGRQVERDADGGWRATGAGEWELWDKDPRDSRHVGDGTEKQIISHSIVGFRMKPELPRSAPPPARDDLGAAPAGHSNTPARPDLGAADPPTWNKGPDSWPPREQFERPSSNQNPGMTFRTDRVDPPQPSRDTSFGGPNGRADAARNTAPRSPRKNSVGSESLLDRFVNWLRSEFSGSAPPSKSSISARARARRPPYSTGTAETDAAIREAARAYGLDVNFMRAVADIESSMNPRAQYVNPKTHRAGPNAAGGLYQFIPSTWAIYGHGGDRLDARASAMAAARYFVSNRDEVQQYLGRVPTNVELYIAHQQGPKYFLHRDRMPRGDNFPRGFSGPRTRSTFEAAWRARIERGIGYYESLKRSQTGP